MTAYPLTALRRQVRRISVLYAAGLGVWAGVLFLLAVDHWFLRVLLTALAAVIVWVFTWPRLGQNHAPGAPDELWPKLGTAHLLTLARTGLLAMLASLIPPLVPGTLLYWGPIVLWSAASALDGADGRVARHQGQVSRLGATLDIAADTLGVLIAVGAAITNFNLPIWFLAVACLHPTYALAIWRRQRQGQPVLEWPESSTRRQIAGIQMFVLGMALWPGVHAELMLATALGLTALLVFGFARDWGCVVGNPTILALQAKRGQGRLRNLQQVWLPAALRPLAALSVLTTLADRVTLQQPFEVLAVSVLVLVCAVLLLGGWWVRTAALFMMVGIGLLATLLPFVPSMPLAVLVGMGLFMLGKGTRATQHLRAQTGGRR